MGRKSKVNDWLTEDALAMITGWARDKLTEKQIAEQKMEVNYSTFNDWKQKYPQLSQAIKKGRTPVAEKIEDNLYSRCEWREVNETFVEERRGKDGQIIETKRRMIKRWVPPSDTAMIFALKQLKREKWGEKIIEDETALNKAKEILGGVDSVID